MASQLKVAILDDYQGVALSSTDWRSLEGKVQIDIFRDTILDVDTLVQRLLPYDIICSMRERTKFSRQVLESLPRLKLLTTTGLHNAAIDVVYAKENGITVSGTSSGGNSTVEHIWALILATVRFIAQEDALMKGPSKGWQAAFPVGLHGKTIGIIGLGRLGLAVAKIAKAFNMRVIAWSPHLTPERTEPFGVEYVNKEALLRESDIVSIHMVLTEQTKHIIDATDLSMMKATAFLVNTSRGPLVDETAMVKCLQGRKIAGAALDVFDIEPLPADHPLRGLDNVTLSPHNGYVNETNYKVFWKQTVENIESFLEGKPLRSL